ncbi:hypothetical protein [Serratia ficaria]|uniref:hypothetical protein n=1 Tax=Serratia ficaria TaxID=61651 RepID=UPI0021B6FEED|nr:hypothetical protein [Serratia ficaria]
MAYHLSVVEIPEEINQQDTPPSSNPHTPQMTITQHPYGQGTVFYGRNIGKWLASWKVYDKESIMFS